LTSDDQNDDRPPPGVDVDDDDEEAVGSDCEPFALLVVESKAFN
jgi:hypothetical protein